MNIEIFADIVCPWCYIGHRRFEAARAEFERGADLTIEYRPFQLDPTAPDTAIPLTEYLQRRFGANARAMQEHVDRAAAGLGIAFQWDRALAVNTRTAHRLMLLARREHDHATQQALLDALFAAHFEDGIDIADHEALTSLASHAGMDADRVRTYLDEREGDAELERELNEARALGIQGVPAFVFERTHLIEGAQPKETFVRALRQLGEAA